MTVMDEIYGGDDDEKKVGSNFAACVWIYTNEGQMLNAAMEEYLKKRMLSIILCTNWVCLGTFEDHEWVSEDTIDQHVEEVVGMKLEEKHGYSVRGAMVHVVVFSTYKAESNLGKTRSEMC